MRRLVYVCLFALALPVIEARAHAMLEQAEPRVGGAVKTAPRTLSLTFTQKLEGSFSSIRVVSANGARVDQGKAQVDPGNPTVLRIGLKPLPPGTYRVQWRVLSIDTHTTEGSFNFKVEP